MHFRRKPSRWPRTIKFGRNHPSLGGHSLEAVNWIWGLLLIALTIAFHVIVIGRGPVRWSMPCWLGRLPGTELGFGTGCWATESSTDIDTLRSS